MKKVIVLAVVFVSALALAGLVGAEDDYGPGPATTTSGGGGGGVAAGESYTYSAPLSATQEVPKPKAPAGARGSFAATVNESATTITLKWKLSFGGLSGKAIAAHIHKGKKGRAGDVIVALCGPCRSGQSGSLELTVAANKAIETGGAYVNVHTARNKAGEIRGQIALVAKS